VDGSINGELTVEVADYDGVYNTYTQKFSIGPNEPLQVLTYAKVATTGPDVRITVKSGDRKITVVNSSHLAMDVGSHMYLALGDNLLDLHESLVLMANPQVKNDPNASKDTRPRYAVYENDVKRLPALWFGYDPVDLAILMTANDKFVDRLLADRQSSPQLAALAEWVRRGGRLVISIAPSSREKVQRLLASPAWQPALPPVLTLDSKTYSLSNLDEFQQWATRGGQNQPLPGKQGKDKKAYGLGVRLQELPSVAVECWTPDGKDRVPLIVQFPHGLGSITLIGFDAKDQFMNEWGGRFAFWQRLLERFAPSSKGGGFEHLPWRGGPGRGQPRWETSADATSRLYQELEKFDTPTISFGWVVLFIFLYILVVGPVDYLILKLLFKRLELTWLTFPAVVITVSLLAYFTAYAIKGQDLKVNKIDLVDIDMRSGMREDGTPGAAKAYGTAWISILSPRIQNYTIGLEPTLYAWQDLDAPAQPVQPTIRCLARPQTGGMGASGRGRTTSLFSRTYSYEPKAVGLRDVPIPVWPTKSFTGSWEAAFQKLPFDVNLSYVPGQNDIKGTLKNNLPFDLHEVGLVYRGKVYPLPDLPKGVVVQVVMDPEGKELWDWVTPGGPQRNFNPYYGQQGPYDPAPVVRYLMFHEKVDRGMTVQNHAHRNLDLSWRMPEPGTESLIREAILVARVQQAKGLLEELHDSKDPRLATHLWLGQLPGTPDEGKTRTLTRPDGKAETVPVYVPRPQMQGHLVQDTYIRVLLPVPPAKQ